MERPSSQLLPNGGLHGSAERPAATTADRW
jgi:hypothetical protein